MTYNEALKAHDELMQEIATTRAAIKATTALLAELQAERLAIESQ